MRHRILALLVLLGMAVSLLGAGPRAGVGSAGPRPERPAAPIVAPAPTPEGEGLALGGVVFRAQVVSTEALHYYYCASSYEQFNYYVMHVLEVYDGTGISAGDLVTVLAFRYDLSPYQELCRVSTWSEPAVRDIVRVTGNARYQSWCGGLLTTDVDACSWPGGAIVEDGPPPDTRTPTPITPSPTPSLSPTPTASDTATPSDTPTPPPTPKATE